MTGPPSPAGAAGLALSAASTGITWPIVMRSIATLGLGSMFGPFLAATTPAMGGVGAVAAIAPVTSVANTGGFVGPYPLGAINGATHSFSAGMFAIAVMLEAGGALVLMAGDEG